MTKPVATADHGSTKPGRSAPRPAPPPAVEVKREWSFGVLLETLLEGGDVDDLVPSLKRRRRE